MTADGHIIDTDQRGEQAHGGDEPEGAISADGESQTDDVGRNVPMGPLAKTNQRRRTAPGRPDAAPRVCAWRVISFEREGKHTLRLNFSNAPPERIEAGIKKLGRLFKSDHF